MTNKHSANRNKKRAAALKVRQTKQQPKFGRFISKNFVGLLSILLSILTSFLIYYLAYSEPDIRAVDIDSSNSATFSNPIEDKNGDCFYYITIKQTFKNLSIKSGYVDKVTFIPLSPDVIPEFKLIDIDKSKFNWREEKEIEIRYSVVLTKDACKLLLDRDEQLIIGINFYDNTGRLLNKTINGEEFSFTAKLTFEGQTVNEQR